MTAGSDSPRPAVDRANQMALVRADYARLLTAARACVAAERDGLNDPLIFVRELLAERGQLPLPDLSVPQLLAAVPADLCLPGRSAQRQAATPFRAGSAHRRLTARRGSLRTRPHHQAAA
jgi:hypothetical protein